MAQRLRTPFAEIDLVVKSRFEVLLIEVKSLSNHDWLAYRVGSRQKLRLRRALIYMQNRFKLGVRFHLATVTKGGEIEIYADFLS